VLCAALTGCGPADDFHRSAGETMGTEYRAAWSGGADCTAGLAQHIETELGRVNGQMSHYLPASELSLFNAAPANEWIAVSRELAEVVALALDLAHQSGGAFDITAYPLVELWGFGPSRRQELPTAGEIETAMAQVGYQRLQVRLSPPELRKASDQLRLDLSAIAKGHGVDRLARLLESRGCANYLIEIGGEVRARGVNPTGEPWRVGIDVQVSGSHHPQLVLRLTDSAVATSGDYRNYRVIGDQRLSHTIDPRTGHPVSHGMASVTVLAESAALADGLATLIHVLGPTDGLRFANRRSIAVLVLTRRNGHFERRYTDAMRDYIDQRP